MVIKYALELQVIGLVGVECHSQDDTADCIVTRDRSHFPGNYMPVVSPEEYRDILKCEDD